MHIFQKNGKFYAKYYLSNKTQKKRLCRGASTKTEALHLAEAYLLEDEKILAGLIQPKIKDISMAKIYQLIENYAKINKKSYEKTDKYIINKLRTQYLPENLIANSIKVSDIEALKATMLNEGKSNGTINKYLNVLKVAFKLAVSEKLLVDNPMLLVKHLKEDTHIIRYLKNDEQKRLYNVLNSSSEYNDLKNIIILWLQAPFRKSEILRLEWGRNVIFNGVDDSYVHLYSDQTKEHKEKIIPLNTIAYNLLKKLHSAKNTDWVFPNPKTNLPYTDLHKSFSTVLNLAQIENFRLYDLRHTTITRLADKGNIVDVMELAGHSNIKTTQRYAHAITERKKQAVKALEQEFEY